jgi:hypothetical protein
VNGAPSAGRVRVALLLFFYLGLPSVAKVHRTFGVVGVCLYVVVAGGSLALLPSREAPPWRWTDGRALAAMLLTVALLGVAFAVVHPRVTAGSDRDEALDLATRELLAGRYPYSHRAFATGAPPGSPGGLISPMPGELILAAPFVVLGTGALQTLFWLVVFFFVARQWLGSPGQALLASEAMLLLCPASLHEIVTGGDLLANALWVAALATAPVAATGVVGAALASAALGIGLSSRAHFLAVLPVVFVAVAQRRGRRPAAVRCAIAGAAFAATTAPFYLHDPAGFSPLHVVSLLDTLGGGGAFTIALSSVIASIVAAAWVARAPPTEAGWLGACAAALDAPVVVAAGLAWARFGMDGFDSHAWRGLSAVPFGVLAALAPRTATAAPGATWKPAEAPSGSS